MPSVYRCEVTECAIRSAAPMGHRRCAGHCSCLTTASFYDPSLCGHCKEFIKANFVGVVEKTTLTKAREEWDLHLRKLRRYTKTIGETLSLPPEVSNIRRAALPPFDLEFFKTLELPESFDPATAADMSDVTSKVTSASKSSSKSSSLSTALLLSLQESLQSGFAALSSDISGVRKTVADQGAEIERLKSGSVTSGTSSPLVVIRHVKGGGYPRLMMVGRVLLLLPLGSLLLFPLFPLLSLLLLLPSRSWLPLLLWVLLSLLRVLLVLRASRGLGMRVILW